MLNPHVVDLHAVKTSVLESLLKCKARMVRVDVDLHHLIIRDENKTVTDRCQEVLHFLLVILRERLLEIDDEFRAVPVLDLVCADLLVTGLCGLLRALRLK